MFSRSAFFVFWLINLFASTVHAQQPFYVPFYGASANGHSSAPRGWNTFGLQANSKHLYKSVGFDFNDYHFAQQCDRIQTQPGWDYVCSLDSGWSTTGGDKYGRIVEDPAVFSWFGSLKGFADHLHSKGLKLGIYLLPGSVTNDRDKTVENTTIKLGDIQDSSTWYYARYSFKWGSNDVEKWHDSQVKYLAAQGVDFIKLDFITPGSSGTGLPADTSQSVIAYHKSIQSYGKGMRLDLSANLELNSAFFPTWQHNADSLRTDTDINNQNAKTFVDWTTVQRAIERYRVFVTDQVGGATTQGKAIMIRPDLDNTYIGNPESISGISDTQRYSMAIHWIGAGANLVTGSDLTHLDELGSELLYNSEAMDVAAFSAQYPMQPRNPSGWGTAGGNAARQCQAWIAGPSPDGTAVVVLTNLGPDQGQGGFKTNWGGKHNVSILLTDLGIGGSSWTVRRVWGGGGSGGPDHTDLGVCHDRVESWLDAGESVLYRFTKVT